MALFLFSREQKSFNGSPIEKGDTFGRKKYMAAGALFCATLVATLAAPIVPKGEESAAAPGDTGALNVTDPWVRGRVVSCPR